MLFIEYVCSMLHDGNDKHCCYGACRSNYRYADTDWMKNVFFIRFSKPQLDRAIAEPWANCRLEDLPLPLSRRTCILSVILCSCRTMCRPTTIYLVHR